MIWTAWRRTRSVAIAMSVVIAIVVVVLLLTGWHQDHLWSLYLRSPCRGGYPTGHIEFCENAAANIFPASQYNTVLVLVTIALGPLFGVVLGVVAVVQEIERRTVRLSWTQSGSRQKWLASNYLVNISTIVALFVPLCLVATWWNHAAHYRPRLHLNGFPITGFSILLMSIFAFVLASALGLFVRRSGWTLAIALVVAFAFFYAVEFYVRSNLVPATFTKTGAYVELGSASGFYGSDGVPANAWQKSNGIALVGSTHAPSSATMQTLYKKLNECYASPRGRGNGGSKYCVPKNHVEFFALYVPDSEYWTLQLRDGSIYVGITLLLAGFSFFTVRRMLA
jgi:ABC-type transport system involved in multi-copper enzyme maturation permease subunit